MIVEPVHPIQGCPFQRRNVLAPFARTGVIASAGLRAMLGAAEALSHAASSGEITPDEAKNELFETIVAMVDRSARDGAHGSSKAGIKWPAKVMRNGE